MLLDAAERLNARERMQRITDVALGFGTLKQAESKRLLRLIERAADLQPRVALTASRIAELEAGGFVVQRAKANG